MMDYINRFIELNSLFQLGKDIDIAVSNTSIRFFDFQSDTNKALGECNYSEISDENINENKTFQYPVFIPTNSHSFDNAILLLHGLNERSWSKYLPWAEFLCQQTGKPIILFPIAFHMNRSPSKWSNPRDLQNLLTVRRQLYAGDRSLSFANVALSERISQNPYRFYSSGRQSVADLTTLLTEIKLGNHSLFNENTQIDVFAYSIGAFLSEITLMSDSQGLFSNSKLFLFCGGGIFSSMMGESRSIMDRAAFDKLYSYYLNEFKSENQENNKNLILLSFNRMISPERDKNTRESFFKNFGDRISGVSLLHDKVMPYEGVKEALGEETANEKIELWDFPFAYNHENPFPVNGKNTEEINSCFHQVFTKAAQFLG